MRYLRSEQFDLLYAVKETPCIYGAVAAKLSGIRSMIAGHRTHTMPTGRLGVGFRLVKRIARGWIVNTDAIAKALSSSHGIDPNAIEVIPNGIDARAFRSDLDPVTARQRLGLSSDARVVTMVAAVRPEKNYEMYLMMARHVLSKMPEVKFFAVGGPRHDDEATLPSLRNRADQLGIAQSVEFLGRRGDVADILAATDVSVLTSKFEGLSNTILESLACGVPVVTTNYPGVHEVISDGHDGFITPQGDHMAMGDRVAHLLGDPVLRARLREAGTTSVETRFSIPTMGRRLLNAFEEYCDPRTISSCPIQP